MTKYTGNTITKAWVEYISFVPHNWYMALWKLTNYPPHLRMENRMKPNKLSNKERLRSIMSFYTNYPKLCCHLIEYGDCRECAEIPFGRDKVLQSLVPVVLAGPRIVLQEHL